MNSQAEIEEAVSDGDVKDAELALARQVIESLVGDFEPEELRSEYRRDLKAMLEAKLSGEEITRPPEPAPDAPVVDLLEALRRSVADVKKRKPASKAGTGAKKAPTASRRRAPARKSD